jgi:hypothetical protein
MDSGSPAGINVFVCESARNENRDLQISFQTAELCSSVVRQEIGTQQVLLNLYSASFRD